MLEVSILLLSVNKIRKKKILLNISPWILKIPWKRKCQPTLVLLPGKFHGQSSLVGTVHGDTKCWTQLSDSALTRSNMS